MKAPPWLIAMRIAEQGRTKFRLGRLGSYTRLIIGCLGVVGETRGVEVFVTDNSRTVAFTVR